MPLARHVEEICPRCNLNGGVWMFEKSEPTIVKECYSCDGCGYEWTERGNT
jgi:DNA-directed RNA polymerase subunit M/transcription elongation factor TFIIS